MSISSRAVTAGSAPVVLDLDPFSDEILSAPYESYAAMRDAGPVLYFSRHDNYAVARLEHVQAVLKDWETFSSARGGIGLGDIRKPGAWRPAGPIVEADPPAHTRVRGVLQRLLSPAVIRSWRESFELQADALIESVVAGGRFDGVTQVAESFVYDVFPKAVGMAPTENLTEKLVLIGELNFDGLGPKNARFLDTERRVQDILPWYARSYQRSNMLPDGFGELIFKAGDAGEIDSGICEGLLRSFLRGGMDTTVSGIGSALWLLATHPQAWAELRANPSLARAVFEESIRLETPITSFYRTTTRDVEFAGVHIPADAKVQVFLGSANRDPRFWVKPDTFDIHRTTLGHVAFGAGVHACIGQMIARLEAEAVLKALARRASHIELDGAPVQRINNCLRSFKSLPLRVRAA
ncbi:MAG: cytochrome P450 [Burkholderiaceae bacterium]|nr:cytochrome P450 [Burkholderiaceae bacterium]MDO9089172.1 cytochrome P450 [Burkholderiaceae bacterium]